MRPSTSMSAEGNTRRGDEKQQQEETQQVVINVLLVGDPGVGKSELIRSLSRKSSAEERKEQENTDPDSPSHTIIISSSLHLHFILHESTSDDLQSLPLDHYPVILFLFDLTRKSTLNNVKTWYRLYRSWRSKSEPSSQGAREKQEGVHLLVGTKYDLWLDSVHPSREEREKWTDLVRRFAHAMRASVVFTSSPSIESTDSSIESPSEERQADPSNIYKVMISKLFQVQCTIPECTDPLQPLILYEGLSR